LPKSLIIKGEVFSGSGEGTKYVELPWVKEQITTELGFTPYPGTLNIKLAEKDIILKNLLKKLKSVEILPEEGFCRGRCFKAFFRDIKCAIVLPEIAEYPKNVVEIVAPVNLREKFCLKDGEMVEVKIVVE